MKRVHFLGILGSGASSVASIAKADGYDVSGCDKASDSEFKSELSEIEVLEGHSSKHLDNIDILAITPAILSLDANNPELLDAKSKGIEVLTWQQFLGKYLLDNKYVIAVSGTHGKSTTTAMIGNLLVDASLDPTICLGAKVSDWSQNFRIGQSKYFIVEADEFNDNFLAIKPDIAVVTNLEMDHPEFFHDVEEIKTSFIKFLTLTRKIIIANIGNPNVAEVVKIVMKKTGVEVTDYSKNEVNLNLKMPGEHNLMNAYAALQVGLTLGIDPKLIRESLTNFSGISRRLELLGEFQGARIYSDFAHHPTEIEASIKALRKNTPDEKLWLIYQPHMFSRTKALFKDFVRTFNNLELDKAFILDIYPSRENDPGDINSQMLVEAINLDHIKYQQTADLAWKMIKDNLSSKDIVVFMGAGDIDKFARGIIQ